MEAATLQQHFRGLCGPRWRTLLATELARFEPAVKRNDIDPITRDAATYLRLQARTEEASRAAQQFPLITAAEALDRTSGEQLKLMTLANMPAAEIATRLQVQADAINCWEKLFFDVRDLLRATDWLMLRVIRPTAASGNAGLAARMKLVLGGGPVVFDALRDAEASVPVDESARLDQLKLLLTITVHEALEIPLENSSDALRLIKIKMEFDLKTRRLELLEGRLAQQKARDQARADRAKAREARAARQLEHKAAKRAEAEARRQQREAAKAALQRDRAAAVARTQQQIRKSPLAKLRWGKSHYPAGPAGMRPDKVELAREVKVAPTVTAPQAPDPLPV